MPAAKDYLKIGEVAQISDLSIRTIRYYEELGFIQVEARTAGNYRLYSPRILNILNTIKKLQDLDYTLEEIKLLLDDVKPATRQERYDTSTKILKKQQKKILEKLTFYKELQEEIDHALEKIETICYKCIHHRPSTMMDCHHCCHLLNLHVV